MQITKLLNDKEIKHGLLLIDKYPKPINKNNVVNTNSALLQFYSGNDGRFPHRAWHRHFVAASAKSRKTWQGVRENF